MINSLFNYFRYLEVNVATATNFTVATRTLDVQLFVFIRIVNLLKLGLIHFFKLST